MSGKPTAATNTQILPLSQRRTGGKGLIQRHSPRGIEHLGGAPRGSTSWEHLVESYGSTICHEMPREGASFKSNLQPQIQLPDQKTPPGRELRVSITFDNFIKDLHIHYLI